MRRVTVSDGAYSSYKLLPWWAVAWPPSSDAKFSYPYVNENPFRHIAQVTDSVSYTVVPPFKSISATCHTSVSPHHYSLVISHCRIHGHSEYNLEEPGTSFALKNKLQLNIVDVRLLLRNLSQLLADSTRCRPDDVNRLAS